jgi:hypothetical protein
MVEAYRAHDANRVIDLSTDFEPSLDTSFYALLRVSALIDLDRAEEALTLIRCVPRAHLPQPGRRRARWLEYVVHRRLGHDRRADELLVELSEEPAPIGAWARRERVSDR